MSHAILRGNPTKAQLYLDMLLDGARKSFGKNGAVKERSEVNMAEILYYTMKQNLDGLHMINGASGQKYTNHQILIQAVPLARALADKYKAGAIVMFVMRNHEYLAAVYYASIFANVVPLLVDPQSTSFELRHFFNLVSPVAVFCDVDRYDDVQKEVNELALNKTTVVVSNDNASLEEFYNGYSKIMDNYQVSQANPEADILLVPTSGSSGLPKATILTHAGLMAHLPTIWVHHEKFPRPTNLALLVSTAQWITNTILMVCCPVFGVSLLMSNKQLTTEHVLEIIEKHRPTLALLGPMFAKSLAISASQNQLNSIETIITAGAPLTENIVISLKEKLSSSAFLKNGMGMTEMQGFIAIPGPHTPWSSNGAIVNVIDYKIVSMDGDELGPNKQGELYLKSRLCMFRGYYKNKAAYLDTMTPDGWYKTSDVIYKNEKEEIYFVERKKFWFKYLNYHVAPEEVEGVISYVSGVQECVVVESEMGPAAAVVLRENCVGDAEVIREQIHQAVQSTLSDYKRLRGGIVFVKKLPCLPSSGKLNRTECKKLVTIHRERGESF